MRDNTEYFLSKTLEPIKMFGLRKKKPVGNVLKLFKIITPKELGLYNSKTINNVVELSVNMFYDEDVFNCIELNYGYKT